MTKFLDLRNKIQPQIKVIYKTIKEKQPWYVELTKTLLAIFIVTTIVWGISRANEDDTPQIEPAPVEMKTFSVMGLVSNTNPDSLSMENATSGDIPEITSFTFDPTTVTKIETSGYVPLQLFDIKSGDKIIVQGVLDNGATIARRIISFTSTPNSTTTATTTDELASTTPDIATTTATTTNELASSTSTTTPSLIDDVYNAVTDTVQDVVDTIFNTITDVFTSTTTPEATTTDETTPTTTPEIIPEVPPTETITTPEVVEETPSDPPPTPDTSGADDVAPTDTVN